MLGPIFLREWRTLPRRPRHYLARAAYLGILWVLAVTVYSATLGWTRTPTLGDMSRFGPLLFFLFCFFQLTLTLFFSALSAASAVALEKDRRTFVLLLLTDLRNYEIVLGKLAGSLLQIGLLLAAVLPVLMGPLLLGGVAVHQVLQAVLVCAAAGLAAGSLGCLIALWRDRTFQALALTVLLLVLYLCLVEGLGAIPAPDLRPRLALARNWLSPVRAMMSVAAGGGGQPVPPAFGFAAAMVLLSVLLNAWAIARLRVWNPSGEPVMQREVPGAEEDEKDRAKAHAAPGKARRVWENPILWREVRTRAYGRWPLLVKAAYLVVIGLICYYALSVVWPPWAPRERPFLAAALGLAPVGILSMLLVSAQAVTAITSERDTGALDLLLVTDLSPKEFIFGKLGGVCFNTLEYLLPPILLAVVYGYYHLLAVAPYPDLAGRYNLEAFLCVAGGSLVVLAFAMVLGVHVALRNHSSRLAIINTLGTVFFLSFGTLVCVWLILINGRFEYQWTSFVFFLGAGIGGLWWVLNGERPSAALGLASWLCPLGVFYAVTNVLVAKPGSDESADPLIPFLVILAAFGFTVSAMLVPLVSEFDVALGRTTGGGE